MTFTVNVHHVWPVFLKFEASVQIYLRDSFEHWLRDSEFQWERH